MPIQNFLWAYMGVQLCGRTNFLWAYNVRPCTPMGVLGVLGVICGRTGRTWAYKGVHGRNIAGADRFTLWPEVENFTEGWAKNFYKVSMNFNSIGSTDLRARPYKAVQFNLHKYYINSDIS